MALSIGILNSYEEVEPYIDTASKGADSERNALGFLPPNAYRQSAEQGKLFVAIDANASFLGHLMFGGVYPHGKVMQVFCDPNFRKRGVARTLVNELIRYSHARSFLSLSARVATDLSAANEFYERMGFVCVSTFPGGKARRRIINYRVRDLQTPSLFDFFPNEHTGLPSFGITAKISTQTPIYAIDLNVLFDVSMQRVRRAEAKSVFRSVFAHEIRLAIAEEFVVELSRYSEQFPDDPFLELARAIPTLEFPNASETVDLERDLAEIVFQERAARGTLSEQDRSDLRHLATAIHSKVSGFITSDKSILRKHDQLKSHFGLNVLGVSDFAGGASHYEKDVNLGQFFRTGETELSIVNHLGSGSVDVHSFLTGLGVPAEDIDEAMSNGDAISPRRHIILRGGGDIVSFASWTLTRAPRKTASVFLCADEGAPGAKVAIDHTIGRICGEASSGAPALIRLEIRAGHPVTRYFALAYGFRGAPEHENHRTLLQKVAFGRVIDSKSWGDTRKLLTSLIDVEIPAHIPKFENPDQAIQVGTPKGKVSISVQHMESLLSPALMILPGRHGAVVPIKREHADGLLGTAENLSLLASPEAILLKDRVYYCTPRAAHVLILGTPILFYESSTDKGRKSIVAAGRVIETSILDRDMIDAETRRRGVLDARGLKKIGMSKKKLAVTFDNIMVFEKTVSLDELGKIGFSDPANLITACRIDSLHLVETINIGLKRG